MNQADADKVLEMDLGVELTQIGNVVGRTGLWKRNHGKFLRLSPQGFMHG